MGQSAASAHFHAAPDLVLDPEDVARIGWAPGPRTAKSALKASRVSAGAGPGPNSAGLQTQPKDFGQKKKTAGKLIPAVSHVGFFDLLLRVPLIPGNTGRGCFGRFEFLAGHFCQLAIGQVAGCLACQQPVNIVSYPSARSGLLNRVPRNLGNLGLLFVLLFLFHGNSPFAYCAPRLACLLGPALRQVAFTALPGLQRQPTACPARARRTLAALPACRSHFVKPCLAPGFF